MEFGVGAPGNVVTAAREADLMGASGVLVGRVLRFREREGGPFSVTRPASVSFEVTLYATAGARRLWTARFSHTQQPANTRVMDAARYPGGGVRWLSVEELARWGASRVAKELAKER